MIVCICYYILKKKCIKYMILVHKIACYQRGRNKTLLSSLSLFPLSLALCTYVCMQGEEDGRKIFHPPLSLSLLAPSLSLSCTHAYVGEDRIKLCHDPLSFPAPISLTLVCAHWQKLYHDSTLFPPSSSSPSSHHPCRFSSLLLPLSILSFSCEHV